MSTIENVAVFLLLALLPLQDTALQNTPLRTLGASASVFPLLCLVAAAIARRLAALDLRVHRRTLLCICYAIGLTVAYLFLFGTSIHDASLLLKSLNLSALAGLYLFGAFGAPYRRNRWLWAGAMCGFALTLLAVLFGPAMDGNALLHATVNADSRPRGFATESSTFSVQVVISGLLATYLANSRPAKTMLLLLTAGLLVFSGSKGGLISLLLCACVYWFARMGLTVGRLLLGSIILLPLVIGVGGLIGQGFQNDALSSGTSIATRATMLFFAFVAVAHNPLGVGFSGFYPALVRYLPAAMESARSLFNFPLVFTEVSQYQYTLENADCKTFFLDQMVAFGIPFAIAFVIFFFRICRNLYFNGEQVLLVGALFSAIALLTYYSSLNAYSIPVLIGVSLSTLRHAKHPLPLRS